MLDLQTDICTHFYAKSYFMNYDIHEAPVFHLSWKSNGTIRVYFFSSDINECSYDINVCDKNAKCVNRIGSYECLCESGYTGNGETCYGMNFKL